MNNLRAFAAIVLPLTANALSFWLVLQLLMRGPRVSDGLTMPLLFVFWMACGFCLGAFQTAIVFPALNPKTRGVVLRITLYIFYSVTFVWPTALTLLRGGWFLKEEMGTYLAAAIVHCGCVLWGVKTTQRFLKNRGLDFLLGKTTPWEKSDE